jgi:cell wall-associated NlpC family hydrolase
MKFIPTGLLGLAAVALVLACGAWDLQGQDAAAGKAPEARAEQVGNAVIETGELEDFDKQPEAVQRLIRKALALVRKDLKYKYGSADPSLGGMDCSGTVYYLLKEQGLKDVPRSSDQMYHWVVDKGQLRPVSASTLESPEFAGLKPGDLLFWSGTYATKGISHTMIYLGRLKEGRKMVMIGSSEGRRYAGIARNGVSVFDFVLPKTGGGSRFVGYGPVPGLVAKESGEAVGSSR